MVENAADCVVVGIDGTDGSAGALRYAVHQARRQRCGLRLVHVGPRYEALTPENPHHPWDMWPGPYDSGQIDATGRSFLQVAQDAVEVQAPDVEVTTVLMSGSRTSELIDAADDGRLLVVGRETRTGIDRVLFGATTASVAARTRVPTTVVPDDWEPRSVPGRVVVGLRDAEQSDEVLEAALVEAAACGGDLDVVHSWQLPSGYTTLIETPSRSKEWVKERTRLIELQLNDLRGRYPDVSVTVRVVHNRPSHAILEAAAGAALVVLMRRSGPRYLGAHLGGTARAVLRAATCPVHIVPQRRGNAV